MTPQMQKYSGSGGDCFRACITSIFDVGLNEFPHLFSKNKAGDIWTQEQWDVVRKWVATKGYQAFWLDPGLTEDKVLIEKLKSLNIYYIATGPSVCGGHNVVMKNEILVHDPIGGYGLDGEPWLYIGFEKLNEFG